MTKERGRLQQGLLGNNGERTITGRGMEGNYLGQLRERSGMGKK